VAGAGCGKTAVMVAKLAYLIEERGISPNDILVLAFNRSVAEEVRARLETLGIQEPEIATFHAKGFELLGRARGRKPAVSALAADSQALLVLLQTHFGALLRDRSFRKRFSKWWVDLRVDASDLEEVETPDERLRRERSLGLRTLDGTRVQSQAEVKVGGRFSAATDRSVRSRALRASSHVNAPASPRDSGLSGSMPTVARLAVSPSATHSLAGESSPAVPPARTHTGLLGHPSRGGGAGGRWFHCSRLGAGDPHR